jgi:hypothetical protein
LLLLLPIIGRGRLSAFDADLIDLELPLTKSRLELERKKDAKREEIRKTERDVQSKLDDVRDRLRELDRRREKLFAKGKVPAQAELDEIEKERTGLFKEQTDLSRENETLRDESQKLQAGTYKEIRAEVEKYEQAQQEHARKRDKLDLERRAAEAANLRWNYWFQWGQLGGVLVLIVGSIGYLSNRQSTVRRVVGAIAIGAVVLLIVAKMNSGRGVLLSLGGAGGDKGLSAYNLSTPQDTLLAEMDMVLNNDIHAWVELRDTNNMKLTDELQLVREKKDTLKVHKQVQWQDQMLLFVSFQRQHHTTYAVEALERVPGQERWRPNFLASEQVKGSDPVLGQEIEQWKNRGSPPPTSKSKNS